MKRTMLVAMLACAMALALAGLAACGSSTSASSTDGTEGASGDSSAEQKNWYETEMGFAFYAELPDGCDIVSQGGRMISANDTHSFEVVLHDSDDGPAKKAAEVNFNPGKAVSSVELGGRTWYTAGENIVGGGYPVSHYFADLSDGRVIFVEVRGYDFNGSEVRTFLETLEIRGE